MNESTEDTERYLYIFNKVKNTKKIASGRRF